MAKSLTKSQNPLVVEFVGLPGSGKTTISHLVASKLEAKGIKIVSREEILKQWHQKNALQKLLQLFSSNSNQWTILVNSLQFAAQVQPLNLFSFVQAIKIFFNVKRNDAVVRGANCQLILLDQGLLQEAWSVVIAGSLPKLSSLKREMLSIFYNRSIIIVNLKIDLDTSVSRVQNRQKKKTKDSYFELMDSAQAYSLVTKYFPYLQEIINCARIAEIPILDIDSSLPVEENSEEIVNWIISQLDN